MVTLPLKDLPESCPIRTRGVEPEKIEAKPDPLPAPMPRSDWPWIIGKIAEHAYDADKGIGELEEIGVEATAKALIAGHDHQADVFLEHFLHVQAVGGRAGAAPAAADQRDFQRVAARRIRTAADAQRADGGGRAGHQCGCF